MKKGLIISLLVILVGAVIWWQFGSNTPAVSVSPTPTSSLSFSPSLSPSPSTSMVQPKITITSPKANETVDALVTVVGKANVFENQFTVRAKDNAGRIVYQANAVMSDAKDAGQYGNYSIKIPIPAGATSPIKIESYSLSPKGDGSYEGYASVLVKLKTTETSSVYAGFLVGNDCTTVQLFPRDIIKTVQFPFMSLAELLKGPTPQEKSLGATTQIPTGVRVNSLSQRSDTMYADFNSTLNQSVAGSCRVQAIRAQITSTLKQFLGVNNVVISIDGKTEGILQP
jgi:hypothetical protein